MINFILYHLSLLLKYTMDLEVAILLVKEEYKINLKIIMKKSEKKKNFFFLKNLYSLFYIFIAGCRAKKFNY